MKDTLFYLKQANKEAWEARKRGNTPFGAILVGPDGKILLRQGNIEITEKDCTGHAESALMRRASIKYSKDFLWECILYSTFEPCAMCSGAVYWGNVGKLVFGTTEKRLLELTGDDAQNPTFDLPCREIFARGQKKIKVLGPFPEFEEESIKPHEGFWNKNRS
ncbi:MAG: nucleoside deaminase [SAR324 cluster bacterium]|nr:nucleoside deaminase [SAR324 cluster bacterium]